MNEGCAHCARPKVDQPVNRSLEPSMRITWCGPDQPPLLLQHWHACCDLKRMVRAVSSTGRYRGRRKWRDRANSGVVGKS